LPMQKKTFKNHVARGIRKTISKERIT